MATAPYDVIQTVLNSSRVKLNDAIQALAGEVLTDNAVFTTQFVNNAWRRLQRGLAARGYLTLEDQAIILAVPAAGSADPGQESWINWAGCFDGVTAFAAPVLPQNFISPLRLWGRQNGTTDSFEDMDMVLRGLPSVPKKDWNELWEWRENAIYMPGSLMDMDWRIRYVRYLPDIVDVGSVRWYNQTIPIPRCLEPLSLLICAEFAGARTPANDQEAAMQSGAVKNFSDKGEGATKLIFNRDVKTKERVTASRQPRSGRGGGRGMWNGGY